MVTQSALSYLPCASISCQTVEFYNDRRLDCIPSGRILHQWAPCRFLDQLCCFVLLTVTGLRAWDEGPAQPKPEPAAASLASPPTIVVGFLGGYIRRDNLLHVEVQLAARLRAEHAPRAYAEVFENHKEPEACAKILRLLDSDHSGNLSDEERRNARIILYGHSWGASEVISLARQLEQDSIPVLLTIQVDSIVKRMKNDELIPANVAEAANFYQTDSVLHGRAEIRTADPQRTQVATAVLSIGQIGSPVRGIVRRQKNVITVLGEVVGVDKDQKCVVVDDADRKRVRIDYDYLVLATGAKHGYFGHEEFAPYAPGLKLWRTLKRFATRSCRHSN
jgi:Pyridine nucleotide-disulphide oxidoreductase